MKMEATIHSVFTRTISPNSSNPNTLPKNALKRKFKKFAAIMEITRKPAPLDISFGIICLKKDRAKETSAGWESAADLKCNPWRVFSQKCGLTISWYKATNAAMLAISQYAGMRDRK